MNKILIIGGSNIDYFGKSKNLLKTNDSNIGKIHISFGGVGRNIAENLARLGADVTFITAFGNDQDGINLKKALKEVNVKTIYPKPIYPQSRYMAIHDLHGDMIVAISDMELINSINAAFLKSITQIKTHEYLVLDTNIDDGAINYIFENYCGKIIVDAISTTKVLKIKPYIKKIFLLKCNLIEAKTLGGNYEGFDLVKNIKNLGVQNIVITSGADDIYYGSDNNINNIKVKKVPQIINATGAGDAMISGIVFGIINNLNLPKAIEIGKKLSELALMSKDAVSKDITINLGLK